jgi:iduronate 2-sulfatase
MFGVCQQCTSSEDKKNEPNVLFIVSDDMRPDLGCYGFPVHSPNIDELANSGMRFTNAFCNVSVCGASRSSFMTGIRPTYDTYNYYNSYAEKDNPEALTLPEYFKQNGYYTIARNKVFGMPDDSDDSWDELWSPVDTIFYWRDYATRKNIILDSLRTKRYGSYPYECAEVSDTAYIDGKLVDMAIKDLRKLKKNKKKFFMAVGFRKPHLPFTAPKKYWDLYDREQFDFPENYVVNETNIPMNAFHNSDEL